MPTDVYIKQEDAVCAVFERIRQIGMEGNPYVLSIRQAVRDVPAADVEPVRRWIPVTERLPEEKISPMTRDYQAYPCVFRAGEEREVRYYKFGRGHFWHGPGCVDEYVTHWAEPMELPEGESEGEGDDG